MSGLYPPQYLVLPLRVQHRLPPNVQAMDLELLMAAHAVLGLVISAFRISQGWAFPLALFGLVGAAATSLSAALLPHFLAMWIASVPLDILWFYYRSDEARTLVNAVVGINMILKVVSGGAAARVLQSQGALPDVDDGAGGFGVARQQWLGGPNAAPFGLPGSWSGQAQGYSDAAEAGNHYGQHSSHQQQGRRYTSIYDEEAETAASERDAPQVRVENIANQVGQQAKAGEAR